MARQLQRTIIITICETWTLVWAEREGESGDEALASGSPPSSTRIRQVEIARTLRVSSSSVTRPLPGDPKQG
jgi:hypothetical protein